MTFGERLKLLRKEKGMNQQELATKLGVAKTTISAWEVGTREPDFEKLTALCDIFDRKLDYVMGRSDDASHFLPTDDDLEVMGAWAAEEDFHETIMKYLRLDAYGKDAVESVIRAEYGRCKEQEVLFPSSNFMLSIRIRTGKEE